MENSLVQVLIFIGIAAYGVWSVVKQAKQKQRKTDVSHPHGENFPFPKTASRDSREKKQEQDWEMIEEGTSGLQALHKVHTHEGSESQKITVGDIEDEMAAAFDNTEKKPLAPEIDLHTAVIYSELLDGAKWKQY